MLAEHALFIAPGVIMSIAQPLYAPKRSQRLVANRVSVADALPAEFPTADKVSIVVSVVDDTPATEHHVCLLLQEIMPEASIISVSMAQTPPDIVLYAMDYISRVGAVALEQYRSSGAALVAIAERGEKIPPSVQLTMPPLIYRPITREGLAKVMEPLRNHIARRWLERGMDEVFSQHYAPPHHAPLDYASPHHANTRRKHVESCILTFPTALGEQEWEAASVLSFEAHGDETILHDDATPARATNVVFVRLGEVADYLATTPVREHFVRVHKSTIVHLRHIHSAAPTNGSASGKDLVLHLVGGRTCVCSRTYKNAFHEAMTRFAEQEGGSWKKQGGLWKQG